MANGADWVDYSMTRHTRKASDTRTDRSTGCQPDGDGPAPRALVSRRTALRILGGSAAVAAA
ncbi:MAG: hypothetical protein ACR2PA_18345, partial [Hyphomicrobiaceae bacterium]